jgi:hypothetical protein
MRRAKSYVKRKDVKALGVTLGLSFFSKSIMNFFGETTKELLSNAYDLNIAPLLLMFTLSLMVTNTITGTKNFKKTFGNNWIVYLIFLVLNCIFLYNYTLIFSNMASLEYANVDFMITGIYRIISGTNPIVSNFIEDEFKNIKFELVKDPFTIYNTLSSGATLLREAFSASLYASITNSIYISVSKLSADPMSFTNNLGVVINSMSGSKIKEINMIGTMLKYFIKSPVNSEELSSLKSIHKSMDIANPLKYIQDLQIINAQIVDTLVEPSKVTTFMNPAMTGFEGNTIDLLTYGMDLLKGTPGMIWEGAKFSASNPFKIVQKILSTMLYMTQLPYEILEPTKVTRGTIKSLSQPLREIVDNLFKNTKDPIILEISQNENLERMLEKFYVMVEGHIEDTLINMERRKKLFRNKLIPFSSYMGMMTLSQCYVLFLFFWFIISNLMETEEDILIEKEQKKAEIEEMKKASERKITNFFKKTTK